MGELSLSLRQKEKLNLIGSLKMLKNATRRWFFYAINGFLRGRELTDEQEAFLDEVSEYLLNNLETIENDRNFIKKAELSPLIVASRNNRNGLS